MDSRWYYSHLLFSGNAGIGKTTLAKILPNQLEVNDPDVLEINASSTNSVEDVRDKIVNFVQMIPLVHLRLCYLMRQITCRQRTSSTTWRNGRVSTTARFILLVTIPIELFCTTQ